MNDLEIRIKELETLIVDLTIKNNNLEKIISKKNEVNVKLCDFLINWYNVHKMNVRKITANGYWLHLNNHILPFFKNKNLFVNELSTIDLNLYFKSKYDEGLSPQTIKHHFSTLRAALNYAKKNELIDRNPCDNVELPHITKYKPDTLTLNEIIDFSKFIKNNLIYIPVLLGGLLGLRRSEIVGLTWNCIDFNNHCVYIKNTYIESYDNEKKEMFFVFKEQTKSNSSTRTLSLPEKLENELKKFRFEQNMEYDKNKKYNTKYLNFVCVNKTGNLITPNYITNHFGKNIKKYLDFGDTRHIRFHDLRHSCATFLHEEFGYDIKDIQIYLGHSDVATTGNIYTHIDQTKIKRISKEIDSKIIF